MRLRVWLAPVLMVSVALGGAACSEDPGASGRADGGGSVDALVPLDDAGDPGGPDGSTPGPDDATTSSVSDAGFDDAGNALDAAPAADAMSGGADARPDGGTYPLTPATATVTLGGQVELTLAAPAGAVPGWLVDGVALGSAELGTLAVQADPRVVVYTAPEDPRVLPPVSHTVTATLGPVTGEAVIRLEYPVPTISSLLPAVLDVGTTTTSIFVTGTGFSSGTTADIDGSPTRVQLVSSTRIDVDATTDRLSRSGTARLRVTNPLPGGGSATADFLVVLRQTTLPPGLDPLVPGLFEGATAGNDPARRPAITYPEPDAVGPHDFAAPVVSWAQPAPLDVCRMRMTGPTAVLDVFTAPGPRPAAENPQATVPAAVWIPVLQGAPRPAPFQLEVSCAQLVRVGGQLQLAGNLIHTSPSQAYEVAAEAATGRIVYFSGSISGLARIDIRPDVQPPDAWIGPGPQFVTDSGRCVGCHSFSRSGGRMAHVAVDPFFGNFGTYEINGAVPTPRFQGMIPTIAEWVAIHPSGNVVLAQNSASALSVYDFDGNFVVQAPTTNLARSMTQPAWSGDGATIAFAGTNTPQTYGPESVQNGSIYTMTYAEVGGTHTFGPARLLAGPATPTGNAYYPSFSPDGQWVVFCRASGGESYNNADGRLWLVKTDGTVGPIALTRANQTAPNNTNSWPRWSPITSGGRYYLMFSSVRDYPPLIGTGPTQLWVTQIDTTRLPADPSSPAIWMSGQDPFTVNLAAEWTQAL